jgi:hypothetical protein
MEVRQGYKQTAVGVIPEDWQTVAATDFVDPNAPICYGVVQVGRDVDTGVPIVAIKFVKVIGSAPLHRTARDLAACRKTPATLWHNRRHQLMPVSHHA